MEKTPVILPYIPQTITVHLGPPDSDAGTVTVPYGDYLKNAASSEIYPTWSDSALRANILAINSYALNRVYTEFYRSRGYDFDITNDTSIDQAFVPGRSYFENISRLVDELFDSYIRRVGFVEPLAAKFCSGTTVTCAGLSQWGSEELARQGYDTVQILRYYYGEDIELVTDAPVQGITESYPGTPLQSGSTGAYVTVVQAALNTVRQYYPAIGASLTVDGIYGERTEQAVRAFQEIFSLVPDGIVGRATWYRLNRIYVAVLRLAELQSQGQRFASLGPYPKDLSLGDTGTDVEAVQYLLNVLAEFLPEIPPSSSSGTFDRSTRDALRALQRLEGLPKTGALDEATWNALLRRYNAIRQQLP